MTLRWIFPPGESNFVVTDEFTLPIDVDLLGIYPHAHYLGRDMLATALLPDGTTKTLIHIKRWDLNWQAVYRYAEPVFLPKNTVLKMRYVYDNSEDNTANPNHPPARVLGRESIDRRDGAPLAAGAAAETIPRAQGDPRMVLQEAWARHEVEKAPGVFEAHYNLGEMLQARGALDEAVEQFQAAVAIRPTTPLPTTRWAARCWRRATRSGAMKRFNVALTSQPDYFDAHYNLGNALASQGRLRRGGRAISGSGPPES